MNKSVTVGKNRFKWEEEMEFFRDLSKVRAKSREITAPERDYAEFNEQHARRVKNGEHEMIMSTIRAKLEEMEQAVPEAVAALELEVLDGTIEAVEKLRNALYQRRSGMVKESDPALARKRDLEDASRRVSFKNLLRKSK